MHMSPESALSSSKYDQEYKIRNGQAYVPKEQKSSEFLDSGLTTMDFIIKIFGES